QGQLSCPWATQECEGSGVAHGQLKSVFGAPRRASLGWRMPAQYGLLFSVLAYRHYFLVAFDLVCFDSCQVSDFKKSVLSFPWPKSWIYSVLFPRNDPEKNCAALAQYTTRPRGRVEVSPPI